MGARLFTFLIFSILSLKISAYSFTSDFNAGIYWQGFPIQSIVEDQDSQTLSQLSQLVNQAVAAWENAVGREIWRVSTNSGGLSGGNSIRWSNNFAAETGFNPQTTLAVTVRYRVGTYFEKYEIILNGENTALRFNSNNMLYQTILHEFGHVIGLDHSEFTSAVMYASLQGINSLSFDDVQGANAAIDTNLNRQAIGFVSELARRDDSSSSSPLACGTIALVSDGGSGPGNGLFSLVFGLIMAMILAFMTSSLGKVCRSLSSTKWPSFI